MAPRPYKVTPVFDQATLPEAIRSAHSTKAGVWGLLRVLEGEARLVFHDPHEVIDVVPDRPAPIPPLALHHVELDGPVRPQVEFFPEPPLPLR